MIWLSPALAQDTARPKRVVSINLCTDQYLLALAAPQQILAVGRYAHDPGVSFQWRSARHYPALHGHAEELLPHRPDLVLAGRYTGRETRHRLRENGIRVFELAPARSVAELSAQIKKIGELLGANEKAAQLQETLAHPTLSRPARSHADDDPLVALYHRGGRVSGRDSWLDALIRAAGFTTLASKLQRDRGFSLPLETLVWERPDFVVTEPVTAQGLGLAYATHAHPALSRPLKANRVLRLGTALTICGGPATPAAIAALSQLGRVLQHIR